MKEWWGNLSIREKQTVSLGGLILVLLALYSFIWSPLTHSVESMRTRLSQNEKLLTWMKLADEQIQSIHLRDKQTVSKQQGSILSVIQTQISQSTLSAELTQLRQMDGGFVQMNFNQVSFDKLIIWLTAIWQEQGFNIVQFSVHSLSDSKGLVKAEIILK